VKRVFIVVILALETTFYLVVLSCMRACLMKRFYVDDNYDCKKEQKVRDKCFFFCVGKRCEEGAGHWPKATIGVKNS